MIIKHMKDKSLNRLALVGTNSQGKTHLISQEFKGTTLKKTILVTNEVKADENLKNSSDSSTLITWLNTLLDNTSARNAIQQEIDKVDLKSINDNSFLTISLKNNLDTYKGIISADVSTNSNQWGKPGSGERFLGQLLLISKILEDNKDNTYEYFVIDEPEQHLHPSLYIKVGKILNKISKQGIKVVIATHSPVITNAFIENTNEIVKIVDGDFVPLKSLSELINKSKNYECYKKDSLKMKDYLIIENNYELYFKNFVLPVIINSLFSKYTLVGEGAIERKIFELYLLKYGSDMEKNDINYALVDGKIFFPIILTVLKEIGIKTITLFDLDNPNQEEHKYLNEVIKKLSDEVIEFNPTIETYLKITKKEYGDKYRGQVVLMSDYYLNNNDLLMNLLSDINKKVEKIINS